MPTQPYTNAKGEILPSVTTILSNLGWSTSQLNRWAWKLGKEGKDLNAELNRAGNIGTIAHFLIEKKIQGIDLSELYYLKGEYPDLDDKILLGAIKAFHNWEKWMTMTKVKPLYPEVKLISEKYQYGGTTDLIAEIENELAITDHKTSAGVYESHLLQLCAYMVAWEEMYPDKPLTGGVHICRFSKYSSQFAHHYYERDYILSLFPVFLACLELEKWRGKIET